VILKPGGGPRAAAGGAAPANLSDSRGDASIREMTLVRWAAVAAVAVLLPAAAGQATASPAAAAHAAAADVRPMPPTPKSAWVATVRRAVNARVAPGYSRRTKAVVQPTAPFAGRLTRLMVTRSTERDGELWVEVLLPKRPNGSRGWIPADAVALASTPYRVEIVLRSRRLTLYRAGRRVMRIPVAIGAPGTPTPTGRFAVAETVHTRTPGAFLGPIVLPLTGFSRTLNEFAGGDGRVAIHGTSLPELIGTRASHGCIRLRNSDIARLARHAVPGTPVAIRR